MATGSMFCLLEPVMWVIWSLY